MTVEYRETEKVDTSHLSQEPMGREEVLALFTPALVMMKDEMHKEELEHLNKVILVTTGRVLADVFVERIGHWSKVLPKHHRHPLSHVKVEEAAIRLMAPHYRQVSFNSNNSSSAPHHFFLARRQLSTRWWLCATTFRGSILTSSWLNILRMSSLPVTWNLSAGRWSLSRKLLPTSNGAWKQNTGSSCLFFKRERG